MPALPEPHSCSWPILHSRIWSYFSCYKSWQRPPSLKARWCSWPLSAIVSRRPRSKSTRRWWWWWRWKVRVSWMRWRSIVRRTWREERWSAIGRVLVAGALRMWRRMLGIQIPFLGSRWCWPSLVCLLLTGRRPWSGRPSIMWKIIDIWPTFHLLAVNESNLAILT